MNIQDKLEAIELDKYFKLASACPVCFATQYVRLFEVNNLVFYECRSCHFRFMNPYLSTEGMGILYENSEILSQINPALGKYYEYQTDRTNSRTIRDYRMVLDFVSKNLTSLKEKPKLFEVGYGTGGFLLEAIRYGFEVDGIETSKENSEHLMQHYGLNVKCGTFDDYTPIKGAYQMVALWDVIEHTIDPHSYIKKAYEMLAPGGLLVLATPNISGLLNKVAESLFFMSMGIIKSAVKQLYVFEHIGYYNPETLGKLVSMEGFKFEKLFFTETDLERYQFSSNLKSFLKAFFWAARRLNLQNRIILVTRKNQS